MAEAEMTFDDKISKMLNAILERVHQIKGGTTVFINVLSTVVLRDIDQHFKDESGPKGKWQDWSPSYRAYLIGQGHKVKGAKGNSKKKGGTAKILQRSGFMRQSLSPGKPVPGGVAWFDTAVYSNRHDQGTMGMPQRQFMWLSESGVEKLSDQMLKFALKEGQ